MSLNSLLEVQQTPATPPQGPETSLRVTQSLDLPTDHSRREELQPVIGQLTRNLLDHPGANELFTSFAVYLARCASQADYAIQVDQQATSLSHTLRIEFDAGDLMQAIRLELAMRIDSVDRSAHKPFANSGADVANVCFVHYSETEAAEAPTTDSGAFDLTLGYKECADGICVSLDYRKDLWNEETVSQWLDDITDLAGRFSDEAHKAWDAIEVVGVRSRERMLDQWNAGAEHHATFVSAQRNDRAFCLHRLIERQVEATPDAIALCFEAESWTYAELNARANEVAYHLKTSGLQPDQLVGVYLDRGLAMVIAMLAIHKAGGGYVPMDPAFPADRLAMIAEDAAIHTLITDEFLVHELSVSTANSLLITPFLSGDGRAENVDSDVHSGNLAYVMYTSGSTGKPKGVQIEHGSAVNYVRAIADKPGLTERDSLLAITTISFDISVTELFVPLIVGASVVIAPRGLAADGERLGSELEAHNVSLLQGTPTTFRLLLESGWKGKPGLTVIVGGEPVPRDLANQLIDAGCEVWDFYGPTETTVWSSFAKLERSHGPVLIGRPLANNRLYVLDDQRHLVPTGVPGDIYIGGHGLARGYSNRPDLTAEKFVTDPFVQDNSARMYDTGDRGRWHPDGTLECMGRSDNQVKVRGYRIELGEIESVLKAQTDVRDAVILVHEDPSGEAQLIAYLLAEPELVVEALRTTLQSTLPSYMVPSSFELLDAFPRTPNQKVDRHAFPAPTFGEAFSETPLVDADDAETTICSIWEQVLNRSSIGMHDNFFQLGGHSVLVAKVQAKLKDAFEKPITIAQVFQYPTVAKLAAYFSDEQPAKRGKLHGERKTGTRDIAIIGMAGKFPGAPDIDTFWQNLRDGIEAIRDFTDEELAAQGVPASVYQDPRYVKRGTVLENHEHFDAEFFGMSPREAELTNPQHRLFLQTVWEALEHSGNVPESYAGDIGLYAGSGHNSYAHAHAGLSGIDYVQYLVGNEQDYLTTRTAFKLGLTGPALNIQTACSTSLVNIHTACQALLSGDCDIAVAGGVSVSWPEGRGYTHEEGLIFSSDGRCRPFDAKADGTVFSQGIGMVVLKPLEKALEDGDSVHAVIRGIAINNDGTRKGGFSAPSIDGQAEVIEQTLAQAGISPETISYVEAHGTGTAVGDPIEMQGLTQAYQSSTEKKQFCAIGSVKANIGHTDAAAGVAGLLKLVQALRHRQLPGLLHYSTPNPELNLENSPFYIQESLTDWQITGPRRAAISSFGLGGTNAHAILEEAPAVLDSGDSRPYQLVPLSAKSPEALSSLEQSWSAHLSGLDPVDIANCAYTAKIGRAGFSHRSFLISSEANPAGDCLTTSVSPMTREAVFMFSGQGAQYEGMARETYKTERVFADSLDACSQLLEDTLGFRLVDALYPSGVQSEHDFTQTALAQPALFSICYAQAMLWMSWGIQPKAMVGHSIGEYVAATLSGVFTLRDALDLVAKRGRLMQAMPKGCMLALPFSAQETASFLSEHPDVDLAATNSPGLTVVAGPEQAIVALERSLQDQGAQPRKVRTSHAFHSRMMGGMLEEYAELVAGKALRKPTIPYLSNVTGDWITDSEAQDPHYYATHIRSTVRFSESIQQLLAKPDRLFIEMGPGRILTGFINQHAPDFDRTVTVATIPSPKGKTPSSRYLIEALGQVWASGQVIDWKGFYAKETRRRVPAPTYQWQTKPYRLDLPKTTASTSEHEKRDDVSQWFYAPTWKHAPNTATPSADSGPCLVVGTLPKALSSQLAGRSLIHVQKGRKFAQKETNQYQLRPGADADFQKLFRQLKAEGNLPSHILFAWTLDAKSYKPSVKRYRDQLDEGFLSAGALLRAISDSLTETAIKIDFLTAQLHDVHGNEALNPNLSLLLSTCLVGTQEFPMVQCRNLDLSQIDVSSSEAIQILQEVDTAKETTAPIVAIRSGRRMTPHYNQVPLDTPKKAPSLLRHGGTYLITGGLGEVGLMTATHLAKKVQAKVILLGRGAFPEPGEWEEILRSTDDAQANLRSKITRLQEIQQAGGEVMAISADVSSASSMKKAITRAEKGMGSLNGVIHAAGIVSSESIQDATADSATRYLSAKTEGTLALYETFQKRDLDFVLLTSSLSAVLGGLGYHSYAAGNTFLDHFARWANRTSCFPWMSVNWDAWRFPRNEAETGKGAAMYRVAMTPTESIDALDRLLDKPHVTREGMVVSTVRIEPRLDQWVHSPAKEQEAEEENNDVSSDSKLGIWDTEEEATLASLWTKMVSRAPTSTSDSFFDLGGDSLGIMTLAAAIQSRFGKAIPLQKILEKPTLGDMASLLTASNPATTAADDKVEDFSSLTLIQAGKPGVRPLYLVHGIGGGLLWGYRNLGEHMNPDQPVYVFSSRGHSGLAEHETVRAMAEAYVADMKQHQPEGPYAIGGYCFGGNVAYEIARVLEENGDKVDLLLIIDAYPYYNSTCQKEVQLESWTERLRFGRNFFHKLTSLGFLSKTERHEHLQRMKRWVSVHLSRKASSLEDEVTTLTNVDNYSEEQAQLWQTHLKMYDSHVDGTYDGPAVIMRTPAQPVFSCHRQDLGWSKLIEGDLEVIPFKGHHDTIFLEPSVKKTAEEVDRLLATRS